MHVLSDPLVIYTGEESGTADLSIVNGAELALGSEATHRLEVDSC